MRRSLAGSLALLLCGCAAGPDYRPTTPDAPARWSEDGVDRISQEPADLSEWWTAFADPTLESLVERALAANLDLQIAAARVREARARVGVVRGELLPQVDAVASATRSRSSENGAIPLADATHSVYSGGFDASWELDVFGGTRRELQAAVADAEASIEQRRAILVSLLGEVARSYVELRGNQRLAAVARQNVANASSTLDLTRTRLEAGLATELDVTRAQSLLAGAQSGLPRFDAASRIAIHRLGVLLGVHPASLAAELEVAAPIPAPPERVLVGLPSELLARRADVRRAERQLAAATARVGAAIADRYPRFSLTAAFGLESIDASDFADAASRAWSIGPAMRWPLFAGGRIRANIELQDAREEQALAIYEQTLLTALEDVENAMVSYLREWDQRRTLAVAADADRRSVALADDLYRNGLTDFLDVLDAERRLHDAELELVESEMSVSLRVVALYKALGGGWELQDGEPYLARDERAADEAQARDA